MTSKKKLQQLIDKYGGELKDKMLDPIFFINEICGVGPANGKLNCYQEYWVRLVQKYKQVNLTAFRSSGKTEALDVCYPIYNAFTQPNWWGIVVSDKEEQAKEILRRIKNKIETNPILSTSIPKNKGDSWSKTELELTNGSRILAKPYTDRLRSWHVNKVMFDEAGEYRDHDVYESNAYSITQARWEIKGSGVVVTGTPKSELDLLHELRKNDSFVSLIFPADMKADEIDTSLVDEYVHDIKGNHKTLWDIRYPKRSLKEKKKQVNNTIKFTREFLCKVLSAGDSLFPHYVIEAAYDYDYGFDDAADKSKTYYMGIDFALSGESGSDFSTYFILQVDDITNITRVVRIERYKGLSYQAQKLRIKQLNATFGPAKIVGDEGTFGKAFIQELKQEGLPIKGFRFQHNRQELLEVLRSAFDSNFTEDKDKDGRSIPHRFKDRKFLINYNQDDPKCQELVEELTNELLGFGVVFRTSRTGNMTGTVKFESMKKHDDLVMGCALAYWACNQRGNLCLQIGRSSGSSKKLLFGST